MSDYRLTCRHCEQRFFETVDLLFHRCPGQANAQNARRKADRRLHHTRLATTTQRLSPAGEGAR